MSTRHDPPPHPPSAPDQARAAFSGHGQTWTRPGRDELRPALSGLLIQLKRYDDLRLRLERQGGTVPELSALGDLLKETVALTPAGRTQEVNLVDPLGLAQALRLAHWNLHLEVRLKPSRLPVYYLCRIETDYWSEYSLLVEDYHLSPGYPLPDPRFARLMRSGHERHFLRLSPLRAGVAGLLAAGEKAQGTATHREPAVDAQLYLLGRHVFQAAWHQDQQVGIMLARHLGLQRFAEAVELLYLCLGGELCELRGAVDQFMLRCFEGPYPQGALRGFLGLLPGLEGGRLNDLPKLALGLYANLSRAFSRLLACEAPWGGERLPTPLWKLVYANLGRLELVAAALAQAPAVRRAGQDLERSAGQVIDELIGRQGG